MANRTRVVSDSDTDDGMAPPPPQRPRRDDDEYEEDEATPPSSAAEDEDDEDAAMRIKPKKNKHAICAEDFLVIFKHKGLALMRGKEPRETTVLYRKAIDGYMTPLYVHLTNNGQPATLVNVLMACFEDGSFGQTHVRNGHAEAVARIIYGDTGRYCDVPPFDGDHVFRNGVFNHRTLKFTAFDEDYEANDFDEVSAHQFHDCDFDDYNWLGMSNLDVPKFDAIIDAQDWDEPKKEFCLAMLGRLGFPIGTDCWDNAPFFIGKAGAGKSTIVRAVLNAFYARKQIGEMGNRNETTFGLENVYTKEAVRFDDVDSSLVSGQGAMDAGNLKKMITGDELSIARKYRGSVDVTWTAPCVFIANEQMKWSDNNDQFTRRITYFSFEKHVSAPDTSIEAELAKPDNKAKLMIRLVRTYKRVRDRHGDLTAIAIVKAHYPSLHGTLEDIRTAQNPVLDFVENYLAPCPGMGIVYVNKLNTWRVKWVEAEENQELEKCRLDDVFWGAMKAKGYECYRGASAVRASPQFKALTDQEKKAKWNLLKNGFIMDVAPNAYTQLMP